MLHEETSPPTAVLACVRSRARRISLLAAGAKQTIGDLVIGHRLVEERVSALPAGTETERAAAAAAGGAVASRAVRVKEPFANIRSELL